MNFKFYRVVSIFKESLNLEFSTCQTLHLPENECLAPQVAQSLCQRPFFISICKKKLKKRLDKILTPFQDEKME